MPALLVGAEDVVHGKPDPEPYLLAAERLGAAADDCIVVEDSIYGTAAGRAAGAAVIAVPCMQDLDEHPGQLLIPTLAGLTVNDLARIWHELKEAADE